jgi:hypothetical protein
VRRRDSNSGEAADHSHAELKLQSIVTAIFSCYFALMRTSMSQHAPIGFNGLRKITVSVRSYGLQQINSV